MICPKHIEEPVSAISSTMAEQHAQSAAELRSSAFTRRRLTETRSRSARNAIPSSLSNMAFFRKKRESDEMREYFGTPSFSFDLHGLGIEAVSSPDEVKRMIRETGKTGIIFIPSPCVLRSPRKWAASFSDAGYLVIIGRKSIPEFRDFLRLVDHLVFSPVPKTLSSAFMEESMEKAFELLHGAGFRDDGILILEAGGTE